VRKKGLFRLALSVELLGKSVVVEVEASAVEHTKRQMSGLHERPGFSLQRSWPF
jgi:hypothetical protein